MKTDLMNVIFGMKVRNARTGIGLGLKEFADKAGLSASYLTEIEKGRKYPKRDKILRIAETAGVDYDDLVSIRLDESLTHLESVLSSPLMSAFPYDEFGVDLADVIDVLTRAPEKVSALLHAVLEITRRYDMKDEHFLRATLRSYQEMRDNHFPEIEKAAAEFIQRHNIAAPIDYETVKTILQEKGKFDITTDQLHHNPDLRHYRSITLRGKNPRLNINGDLLNGQKTFAILREIGHQILETKIRAYTSPPDVVESFEQVLNDYKASYFAGAVMMPRDQIVADIEHFFDQDSWKPEILAGIMEKYDVTPETLFFRMSEIIPEHFGLDLHFLRFKEEDGKFRLAKQINMNNIALPSGFGLNEHYCRRWLTVRLLHDKPEKPDDRPQTADDWQFDAQLSHFYDREDKFLCFGISRPLALQPDHWTSVTVGFRATPDLKNTIKFADDPAIEQTTINDTCERCPISADSCHVRAAPPTVYNRQNAKVTRQKALRELIADYQT